MVSFPTFGNEIFTFMECSISMFLDTRREKEKEAYPLKLRVYSNRLKKAKLYPVNMDLTIEEFQRIWKTERPRGLRASRILKNIQSPSPICNSVPSTNI